MRKITFLIFYTFFSIACLAQQRPDDDVLRPVPVRVRIGPYLGAGYNFSLGHPVTQCKCEYTSGDGAGALFGIVMDYPVKSDFSVTAAIGIQSFQTSYAIFGQRLIASGPDSALVHQLVNYRKEADVSLQVIQLTIAGKWYMGRKRFYIFGGPSLGMIVYNHLYETETIQTPGYVYPGTESTQQVFFDDALKKMYSPPLIRFALIAGTGYDFALSTRWVLSPELAFFNPDPPRYEFRFILENRVMFLSPCFEIRGIVSLSGMDFIQSTGSRMYKFLSFVLVASCILAIPTFSQETAPGGPPSAEKSATPDFRFFAGAHVFGNYYSGAGPSLTCNCELDNGKGAGFAGGIDFEYKISHQWSILASIEYSAIHAIYEKSFDNSEETVNGTTMITFKRAFTADLSYANLILKAKWKPGMGDMFLTAGASYGAFLKGNIKDEERVATAGYVYPEGTNQRIYIDGNLEDSYSANSRITAIGGVGYDFMFGNFQISPELSYTFPITSVTTQAASWKLPALGGGVSIRMGF